MLNQPNKLKIKFSKQILYDIILVTFETTWCVLIQISCDYIHTLAEDIWLVYRTAWIYRKRREQDSVIEQIFLSTEEHKIILMNRSTFGAGYLRQWHHHQPSMIILIKGIWKFPSRRCQLRLVNCVANDVKPLCGTFTSFFFMLS